MAKQRFRDVKQGRITATPKKEKKRSGKTAIGRSATLRERFKAFLTDSFMILMPIMYIVFYLVFSGREGFAAHKLLGWVYILVPYIVVTALFIAKSGQTPGMRAYEIRVVMQGSGEKPSYTVAFLRQLLAVWDFLLFTWVLQFFRKDHRTLHEILSGTALVYSPRQEKGG
ncbi:RDD family protein [Nitratifractor sp.]